MSFRNRCRIAGADGPINLSIPLVQGRDQKTIMKDVRISDRQPWQAQHWKTIVSCYSRSPWFEFYRDELEMIYKKRFDFLLDWNRVCFEWSLRTLGISIPVTLTDGYRKVYSVGEGVDWRGKIMPKDGAAAAAKEEGQDRLSAATGSSGAVLKYHQVFEERTGFIPHLSILDLLCCEGKEAIRYIRS
jgi:WbqC-like protein family